MTVMSKKDPADWNAFMAGPFDHFLEFLDIGTIKNLRLTSLAVSDRCLTPHFKKAFKEIRTTLDPDRLQGLITLLENPFLGRKCIRRLTILATLYDFAPLHMAMATRHWYGGSPDGQVRRLSDIRFSDEWLAALKAGLTWLHTRKLYATSDEAQPVVALLSQILRLLAGLEKLSLDFICVNGPSELVPTGALAVQLTPICASAMDTYRRTTEAMARSQITVDHFDVFTGPLRCALESVEFVKHIDRDLLFDLNFTSGVASQFKKFSLSFSPKTKVNLVELQMLQRRRQESGPFKTTEWRYKGNDSQFDHPDGYWGIAEMLSYMAQLEELDLHQYLVAPADIPRSKQVFKEISHVTLPKLQKLILRGMRADEADLLRFLDAHPALTHLDFQDFQLTSGTWESICRHFKTKMHSLTELCLADLKDSASGSVYLNPDMHSVEVNTDAIVHASDMRFLRKIALHVINGSWELHTQAREAAEAQHLADALTHAVSTLNLL